MNSLRNELFSYIKKKYDADPEYLWHRYPGYAVFRHSDNDKWFCIIMDVSASKLGMPGQELKDIINVKLSDPILTSYLIQQKGFFRGYHIARGNWVSILLDGTEVTRIPVQAEGTRHEVKVIMGDRELSETAAECRKAVKT